MYSHSCNFAYSTFSKISWSFVLPLRIQRQEIIDGFGLEFTHIPCTWKQWTFTYEITTTKQKEKKSRPMLNTFTYLRYKHKAESNGAAEYYD